MVEGVGLDEAFLDVSGAERLFGRPFEAAVAVREAIRSDVGLACSVGVATTKFVAKLASEAAKPSSDRSGVHEGKGVFVVASGEELPFLHPLPVEALWGVGPATAERLRRLGVGSVGDLAALPLDAVEGAVGRASGRHLHALACGIDPRPVEPDRAVKSVGHEETYATDRFDRDDLRRDVVRMADAVASRVRKAGVTGRTVQLKVRFADFATITRSRSVATPIDTAPAIARIAVSLLDGVEIAGGVRLLGVSVAGLGRDKAGVTEQLVLELGSPPAGASPSAAGAPDGGLSDGGLSDGSPSDGDLPDDSVRWQAATGAIDAVRARFGDSAVGPAVLVEGTGLRIGRDSDNRWGPSEKDRDAAPEQKRDG